MKSTAKFILIIYMCFLSASCTAKSDTIPPPDLGIPESLLNKDLRIVVPANWNDLKKAEHFISMQITLATNKQIVVSPDFNARIYLYDDSTKEWKKIENQAHYETPPGEIILHQGDVQELTVLPDLRQASASQNMLLIFASGNVIENGEKTDQVVGTYIILKLKP